TVLHSASRAHLARRNSIWCPEEYRAAKLRRSAHQYRATKTLAGASSIVRCFAGGTSLRLRAPALR
ncbi:MAG: hypothetical protein ACPIOQ_78375, partial [Promethearchaeia archaeon]